MCSKWETNVDSHGEIIYFIGNRNDKESLNDINSVIQRRVCNVNCSALERDGNENIKNSHAFVNVRTIIMLFVFLK